MALGNKKFTIIGQGTLTLSVAKGLVLWAQMLRFAQHDNGPDFATALILSLVAVDNCWVGLYNRCIANLNK